MIATAVISALMTTPSGFTITMTPMTNTGLTAMIKMASPVKVYLELSQVDLA